MLLDLDELVESVRDNVSRAYMGEAVAALRAHALRAAVVSTWTAVAFDIISKVRELAVHEDRSALQFVARVDRAIASNQLQQKQQVEQSLLGEAKETFELVSEAECSDLERLRSDRHRCAHPAFDGEVLFRPSAEQVRAHIVHAIQHLLAHPPVQGKSALTRLKGDLLQSSFPEQQERATEFLRSRYLGRAKLSLVNAMVTVCLKSLLRHAEEELVGRSAQVIRCLIACREVHPDQYRNRVREQLPALCEGLDDSEIQRVFRLVGADPSAWSALDGATQTRLTEIATRFDFSKEPESLVVGALSVPALAPTVMNAIERADAATQSQIIADHPRSELVPLGINVFLDAPGWRAAESLAERVLIPLAPFMAERDVRQVVAGIPGNSQIWDAASVPDLMSTFVDRLPRDPSVASAEWQALFAFLEERGEADAWSKLRRKLEGKGALPVAGA